MPNQIRHANAPAFRRRTLLVTAASTVIALALLTPCLLLADWEALRYQFGTDSMRIAYVEKGVSEGKFIGWTRQRVNEVFGNEFEGVAPEYWWFRVGEDERGQTVRLVLTIRNGVVVETEMYASSS